VILSGSQGVLLLSVSESSLSVKSSRILHTSSASLYGGDNVTFVRTVGMQDIQSGFILVGSKDSEEAYFETLYNLQSGKIDDYWDRQTLINDKVSTGELFLGGDVISYGGLPAPPLDVIISVVTHSHPNSNLLIQWQHPDPTLITSYEIYMGLDGGTVDILSSVVTPGTTRQKFLTVSSDHRYTFQIVAINSSGTSLRSSPVDVEFG